VSSRISGHLERHQVGGEEVFSFIPLALPPREPFLTLDDKGRELLTRAERNLSRLDLAGEMVPSVEWFVYAFVRKEAVVSSQIEGTQATLIDLLAHEAEPAKETTNDVLEVCNYLDALAYCRREMKRPKGLPLSMRLLHEAHQRLMKGVRGTNKLPGEVRRTQNWVGGTRPGNATYVPPPPEQLPALLGDLEKFLHAESELHPLIRAGLVHVQFESIHPYLDGNGRMGRLLVTLLLEHWGLLEEPLLYLSLFLKQHRDQYYQLLTRVRHDGDWEAWTMFFLEGVATIADEAAQSARQLYGLVTGDRERVLSSRTASVMALRLLEQLPRHPIVTIPEAVKLLSSTKPTASKAVGLLEELGILKETTGRQRDRTFSYHRYLDRLRVGTGPT
jgi:Fic family protein